MIFTQINEKVRGFVSTQALLHLLSTAIWPIPSHAYSSVAVHITVYCFTDLQLPTSVEEVPEIDLEAETQAYPILLLHKAIYLCWKTDTWSPYALVIIQACQAQMYL